MVNLAEETRVVLKDNGKTFFDVIWFGDREFRFACDLQDLLNFDYNNGFGANNIPMDFLIVGDDWWLERHEYDGSEWWEYKAMPARPDSVKSSVNLLDFND